MDFHIPNLFLAFLLTKVVMLVIGSNKQSLHLTSLLYKFGVWPKNTNSISYKCYAFALQIVFSFGYTVCLSGAVFESVDFQEATVSIPLSLSCLIICTRITNFYVNNDSMQERLNEIHKFELWNREEQLFIANRLKGFNKLSFAFTVTIYFCLLTQLIVPLFLSDVKLPLPIWFPLNWQHNRLHFWIVYMYSSMAIFVIGHMVMLLQIYTCYLMFMNTIKFEVLGIRFSRLGHLQHNKLDWNDELSSESKELINWVETTILNDNFTNTLIDCAKCHRKIVTYGRFSSILKILFTKPEKFQEYSTNWKKFLWYLPSTNILQQHCNLQRNIYPRICKRIFEEKNNNLYL